MPKMDSFSKTLNIWYLINKRDLPWRKTKDPYIIWLSEIILQQTRVSQGSIYFLKLSATFPNVKLLAEANEDHILKLWQGLGYYSRARNLHKTAKYISHNLNNTFPKNYNELIKLKGVGDYTASAIASICFNEAVATVDGNVFRFLSRYFGVVAPINSTNGAKEFKSIALSILDKKNPGNHNQAMMEFGALICTSKNPRCLECPFSKNCYAKNNDEINNLPQKIKKIKIRKRYFNYIVLMSNEKRTTIQQRNKNDIWKSLFEFPLIESCSEIDVKELINNEIFQTHLMNKSYHISKYNQNSISHKLTHQHLICTFWIVHTNLEKKSSIQWSRLSKFAVPTLIQNFIDEYQK